ncbi:TonB-dependent receptor [Ascidiimonas aurantiaca]|uniref:TonB-dependent receptor n=1 Tax=Ascidiimonas aurantiaca TaxID=1685432 RepID=UPI0030EE5498
MKIYYFILWTVCYTSLAQSNTIININYNEATLEQVFTAIELQTEFKFAYGANIKSRRISNISISTNNINEALEEITRKTSLGFNVMNKTIAVFEKENTLPKQQQRTGTIRGIVYDGEMPGETLAGTSILIRSLNKGVAADLDGSYEITDIPEGNYILEVSFLGYATQRISVDVIGGNITQLNITLKFNTDQLDEVVVSAAINVKYAPLEDSTEESLVSTIKSSDAIVTGISNEQISRSFDIDAAEVVRRVPGITMLNNFVLVRGMDPRYNLTMLNGMITPSSEMDTRAFSYNLLPSSVIDQMVVHKSPSPELPGNFGGGVVKIQTKKTAIARRLQIGYLQQYRTFGSSLSEFVTYEGSDKDWYGGGVEDRELPDILRDPTYTLPNINDYPEELARVGAQLPRVRTPQEDYHALDTRAFINYNDSWRIGNIRLNNLTYVNYELQRQFIETDLTFNGAQFFRDTNNNGEISRGGNNGVYIDSLYVERIRLSAMQNLSLVINDDHKIDFTSFITRNATDELNNREGTDEGNFREKTFSYRYNVRDILQVQLSGDHQIGSHHIYWSAGINRAYDNIPDLQRYKFIFPAEQQDPESGTELWTPEFNAGGGNFNTRLSFDTDEEAEIFQLDYTKDLKSGIKLKAGGYLEQRDRSFNSNMVVIEADLTEPRDTDIVNILDPAPWENVIDTLYTQFRPGRITLNPPAASAFPGRYSFDDEIRAGYIAATIPLFDNKINIHAGVRYEWNERLLFDANGQTIDSIPVSFDGNETIFEPTPNKIQDFLLPSINVTYNISDRTAIRAAYGRTIDRPQYREQSTFQFFDFEAGFNVASNPLLLNAEIDNYDIRWEHYPSPSEFLSVGAFYKRLTNAIEQYDTSSASFVLPVMTPLNTERAEVYGLEVEARKNLGFLAHGLRKMSFIFNGALLESEVVAVEGVDGRPLQGTSPYIINLGLYYGEQDSPTKFSFLYNVAGDRLRIAEGINNSDVGALYERHRHLIDITFSQQLTDNLQVRGGIQNLLNAPFKFYRDGNQNEKFDPGVENAIARSTGDSFRGDYVEREFREGSYISLGLYLTF